MTTHQILTALSTKYPERHFIFEDNQMDLLEWLQRNKPITLKRVKEHEDCKLFFDSAYGDLYLVEQVNNDVQIQCGMDVVVGVNYVAINSYYGDITLAKKVGGES